MRGRAGQSLSTGSCVWDGAELDATQSCSAEWVVEGPRPGDVGGDTPLGRGWAERGRVSRSGQDTEGASLAEGTGVRARGEAAVSWD